MRKLTMIHSGRHVVPSWTRLRFEAQDTLVLFGYSDRACQEKLNLFREDTA